MGPRCWVVDFHDCDEHLPVPNQNFLGPEGQVSSVLHRELEIEINALPEKKAGRGEYYQLLGPVAPGVGRSPHPEFEGCQNYPVHLTEASKVLEIAKGMRVSKGMGTGSEQKRLLHSPV